MKKTFKKVLASMLAAVMVLCAAPLSGIADIDFSELFALKASALLASGSCGEKVTYTFDTGTGLLTISGTGAMTEYSFGSSPFYYESSIKSIVINDGVTNIGESAFEDCKSLTSVTIPDSVTSIGEQAGIILTSVDQSKSADELVTDSAYIEYLNLIDQNPTEETAVEEAPTDDPVDEETAQSFIEKIFNAIMFIVNLIKSFIAEF